jgi:preprotein translocase subunit SecE
MEKLTSYVRESYEELVKHVSWPTLQLLQESTIVVLAATAIVSLLIFFMDGIINFLVNLI